MSAAHFHAWKKRSTVRLPEARPTEVVRHWSCKCGEWKRTVKPMKAHR